MIQLVEVYSDVSKGRDPETGRTKYNLREIFVNPKHVVAVRPDDRMRNMLNEGLLPGYGQATGLYEGLYRSRAKRH